jgi:hypothetical protein
MRAFSWILSSSIFFTTQPGKKTNSYQQPKAEGIRNAVSSVHDRIHPLSYPPDSWPYFLQHMPEENKPILDFMGNQISNQGKHFAILSYDVGTADLQQCADALMRLRAEYLFSQKKYAQIGFHFNSGIYYSWADYLKGMRPGFKERNQILFHSTSSSEISHSEINTASCSFRSYYLKTFE